MDTIRVRTEGCSWQTTDLIGKLTRKTQDQNDTKVMGTVRHRLEGDHSVEAA